MQEIVTIYTPQITARKSFAIGFVVKCIAGLEYRITSSVSDFESAEAPRLVYAEEAITGQFCIPSCGLLDETDIRPLFPETEMQGEIATLFPRNISGAGLGFDIFAAAFFLASRYEEYLPFDADAHGRFAPSESFGHRTGILQTPVTDIWSALLIRKLFDHFELKRPPLNPYRFEATYDIDMAFAYLFRPIARTVGGTMKQLLRGNFSEIRKRCRVLANKEQDPYNTYDFIEELHQEHQVSARFFIHPGTSGKFDKNLNPRNKHYGKWLKDLSDRHYCGLHPSYLSSDKPELLQYEVQVLENITGKKITEARQHFIRIRMPQTYRNYIAAGITDDYSMGYPSAMGFRAGTSHSFPFFDLEKNEETPLMLHPFSIMDGAARYYQKLQAEDAYSSMLEIINCIKKTGGVARTVWHNHELAETDQNSVWLVLYDRLFREAVKL
jgi:hypothetical protein